MFCWYGMGWNHKALMRTEHFMRRAEIQVLIWSILFLNSDMNAHVLNFQLSVFLLSCNIERELQKVKNPNHFPSKNYILLSHFERKCWTVLPLALMYFQVV